MTVDEVSLKDWMNKKGARRAEPNYLNDTKVREKYRPDTDVCPHCKDGACTCKDPGKPDYVFLCTGLWFKTCAMYLKVKGVV